MTVAACLLLGFSVVIYFWKHWYKHHYDPARTLIGNLRVPRAEPSPTSVRLAFSVLLLLVLWSLISDEELAQGEWTPTKTLLLILLFLAGQVFAYWIRRRH